MLDDFLTVLGAIALVFVTVLVLPLYLFLAVLFRRMGGFYYHW